MPPTWVPVVPDEIGSQHDPSDIRRRTARQRQPPQPSCHLAAAASPTYVRGLRSAARAMRVARKLLWPSAMTIIHNELLAKVLGGTAGVAQGPTPNCGDKKSWPNSPGIMPIIGGGAATHPIIPCRDTPTGPTPTLPRLPAPSPLPPNETT